MSRRKRLRLQTSVYCSLMAIGVSLPICAQDEGKSGDWQPYFRALGRFSDRPLTAWLDDREVWSVERSRPDRVAAYHCFNVDQLVRLPQPEAER